jgi:CheY-like chemotaxis protein
MAGCPWTARRRRSAAAGGVLLFALAAAAWSQTPADTPLDALQQVVVESLAAAPRETPAELLDAAIRAADVEAADAAAEWFARFAAAVDAVGERKLDVLADLGDATDPADLQRLERVLAAREPALAQAAATIREAAKLRRRNPQRLAAAAAALASPSAATRLAAADELARAGIDALPVLVPRLEPGTDPAVSRQARDLVALLGAEAREPLLDWLASDDTAAWPGVIEALDASGASDIEAFLLAPALAADVPAAARDAAVRVLARRARERGAAAEPPSRDTAARILAARLDKLLCPAGLPTVDHLLLEPVRDPTAAAAAFGGSVTGLVERPVWNSEARRFDRLRMSPRAARARAALHLARDLAAIDTRDPAAVNLVLLARLEGRLVTAGDASALAPKDLQQPLTGPDGFAAETAADVLTLAIERGMGEAAAGVAAALAPPRGAVAAEPLAPFVRKALVRALAVPDAGLQFAAARTLALAAGEPPYPGSSRVLEILTHAATATGVDRVVVAHPDTEVVDALATDVSRFGYEPVRVSTGREAIFAARERADTVLVLLAARLATPSALETTQLLQQQGIGDAPAVLVVVDPLDDDGRGCFLAQLIMKFADLHGVAVVDRLDSFFEPVTDEATGNVVTLPRFPDALAQAAGPAAVDPASREQARLERLGRAREAFTILTALSRRGWDARPAVPTALAALGTAELYEPAVALLGTLGRPEAQEALANETERSDLPADLRNAALAAFAASVDRYGVLLGCGHVRAVATRYNLAAGSSRDAAGDILEVLDTADRARRGPRPDAPYTRPTR